MSDWSAVIPTRGNVDLGPVLEQVRREPRITEVIIESQPGFYVWNRYAGIKRARNHLIYTQDDDCLVDVGLVLDAYQPGIIVNNMKPGAVPNYSEHTTLVGWGAVFDKYLIDVLRPWPHTDLFLRECDRVFTGLNVHESIQVGVEDLPHATSEQRMCRETQHFSDRRKIEARIRRYIAK